MMDAVLIRYVALNLTPGAGSNDALIAARVVPAGRDGNCVFGRTLHEGEVDSGQAVAYYPYASEELCFPAGSIRFSIKDIDAQAKAGSHGYAPVANTVWTWLTAGLAPDPPFFRYLFAAARALI